MCSNNLHLIDCLTICSSSDSLMLKHLVAIAFYLRINVVRLFVHHIAAMISIGAVLVLNIGKRINLRQFTDHLRLRPLARIITLGARCENLSMTSPFLCLLRATRLLPLHMCLTPSIIYFCCNLARILLRLILMRHILASALVVVCELSRVLHLLALIVAGCCRVISTL